MIKRISVLVVLILFCVIPLASAEIAIGTLSSTNYLLTTQVATSPGASAQFDNIEVNDIETFYGTYRLLREDDGYIPTYGVGAPLTKNVPILGKVGSIDIFTGIIGYTRSYTFLGVETNGYQYIDINWWNATNGLNGDQVITLTFDKSIATGVNITGGARSLDNHPVVGGWLTYQTSNGQPIAGKYSTYKNQVFYNSYSVISPDGVGSTGTITKTVNSTAYPSKILIVNSTSNQTITSDATTNSNDFTFNILQTGNFYIAAYNAVPQFVNSSVLFSGISSTLITTNLYAIDGNTGAKIIGANLSVKDASTGIWYNSTSSVSGFAVNTPYGDLLNIYGTYPGVYTASSELSAVAGGDYYLPMYPPVSAASFGYTNVFINVQDSSTNNIIQDAMVTFRLPSGATTGESTGTSGTARFTSPNNTVLIIGLSKSGYTSISQSISVDNTGADVQHTIKMSRATVTTVPTITNTYGTVITTVPTIDSRTNAQKDSAMMDQLREAGPGIISLCILGIIFGILKMVMK